MSQFSRRGFLGLTGATATTAGLSACAGSGGGAAQGGNSKQVDLWSNHPGKSKPVEQQLLGRFKSSHQGLTTKLTDAGKDYEEVANKFNSALAGGNLPDVVVVSDVTWFNFALNKQLAPLDDLLGKIKASTSDYVPSLVKDYEYKGHHYALPYSRSTPLFYYNKALWKKAGLPDRGPHTWQELAQWAPKLAKAAGSGKSAIVLADGSNYLDWYFQGMLWSLGGAYSQGWDLKFTDPKTVAAAKFLQNLFTQKWARLTTDAAADFAGGTAACTLE